MADADLLNLVLFLPLAGIALLVAVPARTGTADARPVVLGDGRPVRADGVALRPVRRQGRRPAVRDAAAVDRRLGRVLPDRSRRLQHPAGAADRVPRPAGRRGRLHGGHEGRQAVLCDGVPDPVRDAGRVRRAGPVPVLPVLGNDDDPDVPHHRHLGRRAAALRDLQVRALHRVRQHPDAGGGDLSRLLAARRRRASPRSRSPTCTGRSCRCPSRRCCWRPSACRSRSRCRSCRCTPGCPMRTSRPRPRAR